VPTAALAKLFRARLRDGLRRRLPAVFATIPAAVWRQDWVVHIQAVGSGEKALRYLARYIYRVALADTTLIAADADTVTFRYRDAVTRKKKKLTLPAAEFPRRFLPHVLPSGFVKVRYYGLHHPSQRQALALARAALGWQQGRPLPPPEPEPAPRQITCPDCETVMLCVAVLMPGRGATHARAPPNPAGRSG